MVDKERDKFKWRGVYYSMMIAAYQAKEIFSINISALKFHCYLQLKNHCISSFICSLYIDEYATMILLDGIYNLLNDSEFTMDVTEKSLEVYFVNNMVSNL